MLPPELHLGFERQRVAWLEDHQVQRVGSPEDWAPFAGAHQLQEAPDLVELGRAIGDHLRASGIEEPALDLLVDVANRLRAHSWEDTLNTTDDFAVCALSVEGGLDEHASRSVPKPLRARLRKRGLVPTSDRNQKGTADGRRRAVSVSVRTV